MSNKLQHKIDRLWQTTVIRFLPKKVTADFFTWLRLIAIPFIIIELYQERFSTAIIIFAIAALLDSLDGAMARVSGKTSLIGHILDPLIDKILIIALIIFLINVYPYPPLIIIIAIAELGVIILSAILSINIKKRIPAAGWFGKWKMLAEVIGIIGALFFSATTNYYFLNISLAAFIITLPLLLLALGNYYQQLKDPS